MYKVYDTCGQFLAAFPSWKATQEYKLAMGRPDWSIKSPVIRANRVSTEKQKAAVHFCEQALHNCEFNGDINNFYDCSLFLSENLEDAKAIYEEAASSYYSNFDY